MICEIGEAQQRPWPVINSSLWATMIDAPNTNVNNIASHFAFYGKQVPSPFNVRLVSILQTASESIEFKSSS